jgi:BCD family chlorophyll transporter-like MFS transporter
MTAPAPGLPLGWLGILRLGLVQAALGAVVVLATSTLNRVMVVEYALPATLPGLLVALYHAIQVLRPRFGYGSDMGGRRTPWIIGGMVVLAGGGIGAAAATAWMARDTWAGIAAAAAAFIAIGIGVGASGTTLLALLAARTAPTRRAPAATIVWIMMIAGFVVTTAVAGRLLDPYTPLRLVQVAAGVAGLALLTTLLALRGMEPGVAPPTTPPAARPAFRAALAEVWAEPVARRFTVFVFVSMLAYSAQDLILEPFAGMVFGLTVGGSTRLASLQHGGVLAGMVLMAVTVALFGAPLRACIIAGCLGSALAFIALAGAALSGPGWPLHATWFGLGFGNGVFAASAIATMMQLAGQGRGAREGTRMGLWGAAQGIAYGAGGLLGTVAYDAAHLALARPDTAYMTVFVAEAVAFLVSAALAARIGGVTAPRGAELAPAGS